MKVKCLQCEHEFELKRVYHDELGDFTVCPECDGSFDVDYSEDALMEDLLSYEKYILAR